MKNIHDYQKAYTHSGKFHADDVLSAAFIRILRPDMPIYRTPHVAKNIDTQKNLAFDIGEGEFDHHQVNNEIRTETDMYKNQMPYAAFGLLWREFAHHLNISEETIKDIDTKFIRWMDKTDNCGGLNTLSTMITAYNPMPDSNENPDDQFENAVKLCIPMLKRFIDRCENENKSKMQLRKLMKTQSVTSADILILEKYMQGIDELSSTDICYVIFPSNRDAGYIIKAVAEKNYPQTPKIPFPDEWRKCENNKLPEMTGINGFIFCHREGFIASASDKKSAIAIAKKSMEINHPFLYDAAFPRTDNKLDLIEIADYSTTNTKDTE